MLAKCTVSIGPYVIQPVTYRLLVVRGRGCLHQICHRGSRLVFLGAFLLSNDLQHVVRSVFWHSGHATTDAKQVIVHNCGHGKVVKHGVDLFPDCGSLFASELANAVC